MKIAIVGAGLVGRVLALNLLKKGHKLTLFDKDEAYGDEPAGITAAGMLALFAELESAESVIFEKGKRSIELWPGILEDLGISEAYQQIGTIITAHPQDQSELDHFISTLKSKVKEANEIVELDKDGITDLEPDLTQHQKAFYIPHEGQVNAQMFMKRTSDFLLDHPDVTWHEKREIADPKSLKDDFDFVFDSRGMGADVDIKDLRGVRGEVYWLESDEVKISRPTRMLHPRYKIYIVPRPDNLYIIGATEIESEDKSQVSVRSTLEMMSAVFSMHSGFGEARIIKTVTNLRPTLNDNLPKIYYEDKLIRINGLYRHGYLMAPSVVEEALKEGGFL
jgi:glycine oxidase